MEELAYLSAVEVAALYRLKRLSPVELVTATLANIDRQNPRLNAYRVVDHEAALRGARASEQRWTEGSPLSPVDGIPFGVKVLVLAGGHTTLFGSCARVPDPDTSVDAPAVARLREAGCVFLGKTTTSEFGWKGTADSPLTGITRNARNDAYTSGGSSGGAGVAAAAGMGVFQLGTDGGGSVRIPATFNGVFGFKATFGRVPAWPAGPMMTLSNVGVLTRTVGDGAAMLDVITKPDPRDWYALPPRALDFTGHPDQAVAGKKFGLYLGAVSASIDHEIKAAMQRLASAIEHAGGLVEEVLLPIEDLHEIFVAHWYAGAQHLVAQVPPERQGMIDKGLADAAARGRALDVPTYYRATFIRQRVGENLQTLAREYAALITPTVPILPFEAGREWPAERRCESWLDWAGFLYPFNLSRQPAASVPIAHSANGLPIGAQLIGALYDDENVVAIARAIESLCAQQPPVDATGTHAAPARRGY
jgi:aspartyl-tRNA(Asn)/glutamyl-tRNA(Gln) amidotransferase subunit A